MSDAELEELRERAELGDEDAAARGEQVQLAARRGDLAEVRRLAAAGDRDAAAVLDALYPFDPTADGT